MDHNLEIIFPFAGNDDRGYGVRYNLAASMRGECTILGDILDTSITQIGYGPRCFNKYTTSRIMGKEVKPSIEDVTDEAVYMQLTKVKITTFHLGKECVSIECIFKHPHL